MVCFKPILYVMFQVSIICVDDVPVTVELHLNSGCLWFVSSSYTWADVIWFPVFYTYKCSHESGTHNLHLLYFFLEQNYSRDFRSKWTPLSSIVSEDT